MKTRTILDGNAFYEVDEECMSNRRQTQETNRRDRTKAVSPQENRETYQEKRKKH